MTEGDVIAATVMSRRALTEFFANEIADAKAKGVLLSLHLKATMMKVSDPIMFGHAVTAYYKDVFDKHAATVRDARRRSGQRHRRRLRQDSEAAGRAARSDRGRHSGRLRVAAGTGDGRFEQGDHQPARAERRDHRRLDAGGDPRLGPDVGTRRQAARHEGDDPRSLRTPGSIRRPSTTAGSTARSTCATMGTVSNVGLMAQSAEEYGSHDKTFEIPAAGTVRVVDGAGRRSSSTRSSRATSGACAGRATCRSGTGSGWP